MHKTTAPDIENKEFKILPQDLKFDTKFLRDAWALLKPYWLSEEKKSAWFLLLLNFICVFGEVGAGVGYNHFHKIFFDALQAFNNHAILYSIYYFLVDRSILLISLGGSIYFSGLLSIRWRRWLTKKYLQQWLHNHNHYRMQSLNQNIDNPDQRISEDLDNFANQTLELFFGPYKFLQSMMYLISFGYVLWDISNQFYFHSGTSSFVIPGYLCWVALLYSVVGIWIIKWLGKKLSLLDYNQQRLNADFRFGLIRLRESSEQVSLYRGEAHENNKFNGVFNQIFDNFVNIVSLKTRLAVFNRFYTVLSYLVSFAVSLPFYISKALQFGTVMQVANAYATVVDACSIFISSFSDFAEWRAVIHRLTEFTQSMAALPQIREHSIAIKEHNEPSIVVTNLHLSLPNGKELLQEINLKIGRGQRILLNGPSGVGKSTFLRAMAGIWTHGKGEIYIPKSAKILFLPQKTYLPLGSFRDLLCYPQDAYGDDKIDEVLTLCCLEKFKSQLNETKNWAHELSLGEQQLISFARLFLYRPDLIFLDEATANLDEQTEFHLYANLKKYLPHATLISVAHRTSLRNFHETVINFSCITQARGIMIERVEKDFMVPEAL